MRIVFMGTPDLSATVLEKLMTTEDELVAVVTQPDRPKGRKGELAMSPVKELALSRGIKVFQPEKVKEEGFLSELRKLEPDLIVVAAFGQILPEAVLTLPPLGCINLHTSLLPKYRGASPIQWAIINGEEKTGVTIMYMAKGLDTGDIIEQCEVALDKKETAETLHDKLANAGAELLIETIDKLKKGTALRRAQDDSLATYVSVLDKSLGEIDFNSSAIAVERLIRGLNPWPSAYTFVEGKSLKLWDADVCTDIVAAEFADAMNGAIVRVKKDSFIVKLAEGLLEVKEVQLEGKKRMKVGDFLRGYGSLEGIVLGR